ncbi:MAG TPA: sigma-70 family RNA polymerase sigma factor [Steroidobacteraceae bacterium]|nr:sigma-70 family RNA polymerase sigma factor [Steroidobacteraceae bacterium]
MEAPVTAWQSTDLTREGPGAAPPLARAAALEAVMRQHNQRLYRLALSLVGDPDDAEDVLQESYFHAFEKRASFAGRSGLGAWLARIVRNQAIDCLRARRSRRAAFAFEAELPFGQSESQSPVESVPMQGTFGNPELGVERDEARAALESAILALPTPFRAVFVLREVEGLSLQETARYLAIPVATVKTRAHRARLLLQAELGSEFPGEPHVSFEFLRERCDRIVANVLRRLALL